jgi:NADH-quinone oxidoreductase subunit L
MAVALGASAYSVAIFHLMTHAFFKALLFLAAGSVIIALHHEQDIWKMGNLRKYMPITWFTFLIGTLALIGTPGFAGFYSKDSIIEAVHASTTPGASFAWLCVFIGVFITSFYSFRLYFVVFHGQERMDHHTREHLHESPAVVWVPLVLLAIPSVISGYFTIQPLLFGDFFQESLVILPPHQVVEELGREFHNPLSFALDGFLGAPFWLVVAGTVSAWYCYLQRPELPGQLSQRFAGIYQVLIQKYGFDDFYQAFFAGGTRRLGQGLWKYADAGLIDGVLVNGTANLVGWVASVVRQVQSGYLYHYAFAMIIGLLGLLTWFAWPFAR